MEYLKLETLQVGNLVGLMKAFNRNYVNPVATVVRVTKTLVEVQEKGAKETLVFNKRSGMERGQSRYARYVNRLVTVGELAAGNQRVLEAKVLSNAREDLKKAFDEKFAALTPGQCKVVTKMLEEM